MSRVGITGHQTLPANGIEYIRERIRRILHDQLPPLEGSSSLAAGADQLFAELLLEAGGSLTAVIPAPDAATVMTASDAKLFDRLRQRATREVILDFPHVSEAAYDAAGEWIARNSDLMIAVWDGKPARGRGGTADAVAHARAFGTRVEVVWPAGASRP